MEQQPPLAGAERQLEREPKASSAAPAKAGCSACPRLAHLRSALLLPPESAFTHWRRRWARQKLSCLPSPPLPGKAAASCIGARCAQRRARCSLSAPCCPSLRTPSRGSARPTELAVAAQSRLQAAPPPGWRPPAAVRSGKPPWPCPLLVMCSHCCGWRAQQDAQKRRAGQAAVCRLPRPAFAHGCISGGACCSILPEMWRSTPRLGALLLRQVQSGYSAPLWAASVCLPCWGNAQQHEARAPALRPGFTGREVGAGAPVGMRSAATRSRQQWATASQVCQLAHVASQFLGARAQRTSARALARLGVPRQATCWPLEQQCCQLCWPPTQAPALWVPKGSKASWQQTCQAPPLPSRQLKGGLLVDVRPGVSRSRDKENTHHDGLKTSSRPLAPLTCFPRRRLVTFDARPASTTQQLTFLCARGKVGGKMYT